MPKKIKRTYRIVLVADTHIGAERSPKWRGLNITPEQYDRPFNEALEWADNNDADLTIVAGDLYHSRSPLPTDYRRAKTILNWVRRVRRYRGGRTPETARAERRSDP